MLLLGFSVDLPRDLILWELLRGLSALNSVRLPSPRPAAGGLGQGRAPERGRS